LADMDPMVRIGGLDMIEALPVEQRWPLAAPCLSDSVRGVRIRAAELLASVPPQRRPATDAAAFARAAAEFVATQRLNADRPDARTALGNFYARQDNATAAEAEYRTAIRLDPSFTAASVNLSDLYRQLGRDEDGVQALRTALATSARDASLHHALGLALVRQGKLDAALVELGRGAELEPGQPQYAYVYAVALDSAGRLDEALAVLQQSLRRHPNNREVLSAALAYSRKKGDAVLALEYAERLARGVPGDPNLSKLTDELRRRQSGTPAEKPAH
jgi:Flp pilus assembly protein TadD